MSVKAILVGQGSGGTSTFEAVYGTTTSAEIEAAYQKGQDVVCKYNGNVYQLIGRASSTSHTFGVTTNSAGTLTDSSLICSADAWSTSNVSVTPSLLAPLASPTLTGTPTAPTAAAGTNTTQVATTAFVQTAVSNVPSAIVTTGTATCPVGTSWTGPDDDTGLYTYTVSITGMTAAKNIHITPVIDVTDADTGNAQQDAWDTHYWSETVAGGIKFYAAEQPGVAVQFAWEVIE